MYSRRSLTVILSLMILGAIVLPTAAQEGVLVPAPERMGTTPSAPSLRGNASSSFAQTAPYENEYQVFLPIVQKAAPWIDTSFRAASLQAYRQRYFVAAPIDPQWTGSYNACDPGDVSPELKSAILRRINYLRGMAGVPAEVTLNPEYSRKAQAAALLISINRELSHDPPSSWTCWSQDGAAGSANSNLTLGGFGVDAIKGWMRDRGQNNSATGHRRWILYPQTREMGTGNVPAGDGNTYGAALWVFDSNLFGTRPSTRDEFVAWPPPGYVPYQVTFARWSFSYPDASFAQATVSMTGSGGTPVPVSVEPLEDGFGENTVVWIPFGLSDGADWPQPAGDTVYQVTIQNVKVGEALRSFSYDVIIFDPDA